MRMAIPRTKSTGNILDYRKQIMTGVNKIWMSNFLLSKGLLLYFLANSVFIIMLPASAKDEKYFVKASGGLNLRESPSVKAKNIALIPDNSQIDILLKQDKLETISGKLAPWLKIRYKSHTGWVFAGFVYKINREIKSPGGTYILREWAREENCDYNYHQPADCVNEIYNAKNGKLVQKETLTGITEWYDDRRLLLNKEIGDCGGMLLARTTYDVTNRKSEEIFNLSVTSACGMETAESEIQNITTLTVPQGDFFIEYNEKSKVTVLYKISGKINDFFKREERDENGSIYIKYIPNYSLLNEVKRWNDSAPPEIERSCLPEACLKINGKAVKLKSLLK